MSTQTPSIKLRQPSPRSQRIFVISDLHLGGRPGFQCFTSAQRLSAMIRWVAAQQTHAQDVHLVVAGDIVDFLAEEPFSAFTCDEDAVVRKLESAMDCTLPVWEALRELGRTGAKLTLQLGNHDLELSLPLPRRLLLEYLGHGQLEFLYDNQALAIGPVLIEHGNRYDRWNAVAHDELRRIRSALTRGEEPITFSPPPGSLLVEQVMNPLKRKYSFVDLLKPETAAVLPLLAVLEPWAAKRIRQLLRGALASKFRRVDENGVPKAAGYRGDPPQESAVASAGSERASFSLSDADQLLVQETMRLGGTPLREEEATTLARREGESADRGLSESMAEAQASLLVLWAANQDRPQQVRRLQQAWRLLVEHHHRTFSISEEAPEYLRAAQALAGRGFKAVVFGHTHLAKQIQLDFGVRYLNTGTWADLMRVPAHLLIQDDAKAEQELAAFVEDLASNRIAHWRYQVPSFAQIDLRPDGEVDAEVLVWRDEGRPLKLKETVSL